MTLSAVKAMWKSLEVIAASALIVGAVCLVYGIYTSLEIVWDSYAQWDAALAIIHHLKTHNCAWPRNWPELEESYKTTPELKGSKSWDDLKQRVDVDFQAVPSQLAGSQVKDDQPPFRVVWLRNGKSHHWSGAEPNILILEYLNSSTNRLTNQTISK